MDDLYEMLKDDPIGCREEAKKLLFADAPTVPEQNLGIKLLTRAVKLQDAEAMYLMANQFLERKMKPLQGGYMENALRLMEKSAELGYEPAKTYMQQAAPNPPEESFRYAASCIHDYAVIRMRTHMILYGKGNPKKRLFVWLALYAVLLVYIVTMSLVFDTTDDTLRLIVLWSVLIFVILYMHFEIPKNQYKMMGRYKDFKQEYIFTEDRIHLQASLSSQPITQIVRYDAIFRIRETDRYLFVWLDRRQWFAVDKLTFNGGMPEALREKLRSYLGKKYVRCRY